MADYVASLDVRLDDAVSDNANASADALGRLGEVADTTTEKVGRVGPGFASVNKALDENAALAAKTAAANARLQSQLETLRAEFARNGGSADDLAEKERRAILLRDNAVQAAQRQAAAMRDLFTVSTASAAVENTVADAQGRTVISATALGPAVRNSAAAMTGVADTAGKAASAHEHFSLASAGATRELIVLGHEMLQGNFSRFGGSLLVLAERAGGLGGIISKLKDFALSAAGAFTFMGVAALGTLISMAVHAEENARRLDELSAKLRTTRTDYEAMTLAIDASAKRVAATSTLSKPDALAAATVIGSSAAFSGTAAEMDKLVRLSADLAKAFEITVPAAAAKLAAGLAAPGVEAQKLADSGFPGMDQALARTIERMQAQGHTAEAAALLNGVYAATLGGVADKGTALQIALRDLGKVFGSTGDSGKTFGESIGTWVDGGLTNLVKTITEQIKELKEVWNYIDTHAIKPVAGLFNRPVVDAGTGLTPNRSAGLSSQVGSRIDDIAQANNIPSTIADLGTRIAYQESRGQQFNATGGVLTNAQSGAMGIGQLLPSTARGLGVDPSTEEGNILGMLKYLVQLSQNPQFKTDADIAGAYNAGPGRYGAYLNGQGNPLKPETVGYVQNVAGVSIPASRTGAAADDMVLPDVNVTARRTPAVVDEAYKTAASTLGASLENLDDKISLYVMAIGKANAAGITSGPILDRLTAGLAKARGEYDGLKSPTDAVTQGITDQLGPLSAATGAARTLAEAQNTLTLAARRQGEEASPAQRLALENAEMTKLAVTFKDAVDVVDAATEAQDRLNVSYDSGAKSVIEAANRNKAENEVNKTARDGTALYTEEVDRLTEAYNKQSASKAAAATLAQGVTQNNELDTLKLEASLIGATNAARDKELALLKERQRLVTAGGPEALNRKDSQDSLARVAMIADETDALKIQQNAMKDLSGIGTTAFDKIGTAITGAFATGSLKALNFRGLMSAVFSEIAQQVLKLAVLNPVLNSLFGGDHRTTISDVGGVIGNLTGNTGSTPAAAGSGGSGLGSQLADVAGLAKAGGGSGSGGGILSSIGGFLGLGGATGAATDALAATSSTNIALNGLGAGVFGPATSTAVTSAGFASALGFGPDAASTISSGVSSISSALPYIGAGVGVITNLAKGNFLGAGTTAAGAAIGSVIPGVGTAIGAAVGGLVGTLFGGAHPKSPYSFTDVNVADGRLETGRTLSQVIAPDTKGAVTSFADSVNSLLTAAKLEIANPAGRLGVVSDAKSTIGVHDPAELFKTLSFKTDSSVNQDSNYGRIAAGVLGGQQFLTPADLQTTLAGAANLTAVVDSLGIQVKSVGVKLNAIQIASVDSTGAAGQTPDFRKALSTGLTGKTFDNQGALVAEVTRIDKLVNTTIPALLNPVFEVSTPLQTQIFALAKTYKDAIREAGDLGLATDGLTESMGKAIRKLQDPAIQQLNLDNLAVTQRGQVATGQDTTGTQLQIFDINADKQRQALKDSYTNIYGDLRIVQDLYGAASVSLDKTLASERISTQTSLAAALVASEKQAAAARVAAVRAAGDGLDNVNTTFISIRARQAAASGDQKTSDLMTFDDKAASEQKAYARQLVDFYGDSFYQSQDYENRMSELTTVQQVERLAIVNKYGAATTAAATQSLAAVQSLVVSLRDYARGLQTSALSPLSAKAQYSLAGDQFTATAAKAAGGDYKATSQLQAMSDSLLNTSRTVNGSGVAYAADFARVVDALDKVASNPVEPLTASYAASIAQQQTTAIVDELVNLKNEVIALRRETQQQARAA